MYCVMKDLVSDVRLYKDWKVGSWKMGVRRRRVWWETGVVMVLVRLEADRLTKL